MRSKTRLTASAATPRARRTVRGKLQMLVLISVGVSVGLVAGVSALRDSRRQAELQADRLHATAAAIGSVASEATAAGDRSKAFGALRSIALMPGVLYARIEDPAGRLLVETGSGSRLLRDVEVGAGGQAGLLSTLTTRTFEVTAPIRYARTDVGKIVLLAQSEGVLGLFLSSLLTSAAAAIAAMFAGLLAASRLQRSVTRPIVALTRSMQEVERDHDYSRTVAIKADDEIGELVDGFNRMLHEVRARDASIAANLAGLERQIADRTVDLSVAKDAAEQANSAKSDFLATMSHEIRTPMNGIMVMAEMLAAGDMPPRQRRFAEVIAKSGSSLLAIINDILDLSKIEAGKMDLESLPLDLCEVVEDVCSLFWDKASSKGLDLSAYVDPATPRLILGDPTRLRQVVGNLVNNAIKFTESGGVLIEVEPDAAGSLRISVRDTGVGIPKDKIAGVFGAFTQADQSTTRKFGGTGLGLAICKKLVDSMGGRFHVTSDVGRGSTFAFRIPAAVAEAAAPWPTAARVGLSALVLHQGVSTRRALSRYLARAGYGLAEIDGHGGGTEDDPVLTLGGAEGLRGRGRRGLPSVCLGEYGDSAPAELQRDGLAQAVLIQPFRRRELEALLGQLARGEPLRDVAEAGALTGAASGAALPTFPGARVLVADDSAVNREVALEALARLGIEARSVNDGRAAVDAVLAEQFDLVLMDGSMPVIDGYEATREIRLAQAHAGAKPTPVVALTAHVIGHAAEAWREAGMEAVLHKPFTLAAMAAVLGRFLTAGEPVALMTAPLSDVVAPPALDTDLLDAQVVGQLAEMASAGKADFVARVCALYSDNAPTAVSALADSVTQEDAEGAARAAHALKSMSYNVGAKAVSTLAGGMESGAREGRLPTRDDVERLSATLRRTLQALSGAPERARNTDAPNGDRALLADLEQALASDQLSMAYQPQFDRDGDRVLGVEALIRWTHPTRGFVSPADFIPIAERHGLIPCITDWVVDRVIADSRRLQAVPIAFNVSAAEFKQADFVGRMLARFDRPDVDKGRFEIEITETVVLDEEAQVVKNIHRLHEHGFKIALDDFGAGHTSLRNLRRIPFDKLKIDREFVVDCIADVQSASLVHAVVSIGRALGMKVVAEGVETELQRKFLKVAGVHAMQGYLFCKPVSIEAVEKIRRGALEPAPARRESA